MGIRSQISRNTLDHANSQRNFTLYSDFANILIGIARELYFDDDFGAELENTVYDLDSTTIDLCLSAFLWAKFRKTKGAVKLHTLLDLRGSIPTFTHITDGNVHEVNVLDELLIELGAFYVFDRGHLDFSRLYKITLNLAFL